MSGGAPRAANSGPVVSGHGGGHEDRRGRHCGAVRYEIANEPGFSFFSQCRDCQRFSGSGHMANIVFPAEAMSLTGKTAT